jgi:hypothetical protein
MKTEKAPGEREYHRKLKLLVGLGEDVLEKIITILD